MISPASRLSSESLPAGGRHTKIQTDLQTRVSGPRMRAKNYKANSLFGLFTVVHSAFRKLLAVCGPGLPEVT